MQSVREVYSLLMPIKDGRIVVPRAAVAEVMGYSKPRERPADAPDFLLGFVEWQGQKIPLVSFEAARGQDVPELGRRTRIAVVFGIAGHLKPDVFALVTQGYPYLVRVNENVLRHEPMDSEDPMILTRVRMANEKPFIPDLEALETKIAAGLGIAMEPEEEASPTDELDALSGGEEDFEAGLLDSGDDDGEKDYEAGLTGSVDDLAHPDDLDAADVPEVTAFGVTDYSAELGELSAVLGEDSAVGDDDAIELDGIDVAENSALDEPSAEESEPSASFTSEDDDGSEDADFGFSDFELDLEQDDDKKND